MNPVRRRLTVVNAPSSSGVIATATAGNNEGGGAAGWSSQQSTGESQAELMELVKRTLEPTSQVWLPRQRAAQKQQEAKATAMPRPDDSSASLAYRVGELAKVNCLDEALKLIEILSRQSSPDLER